MEDLIIDEIDLKKEREKGLIEIELDGEIIGKKKVFGKMMSDGREEMKKEVGENVMD